MTTINANVTTVVTPTEVVPVVKNITLDQLVEGLMAQRGAKFISFTHDKEPSKMRKTGNPFVGDCYKWQKVNGMLNFRYAENVIRRLEKEGKSIEDFDRGESWHEAVTRSDGTLTPFLRNKKDPRQIYLRFMLLEVLGVRYHNAAGDTISTDEVMKFMPPKSEYKNQGLDAPLVFQAWSIDAIRSLTIDGVTYLVTK